MNCLSRQLLVVLLLALLSSCATLAPPESILIPDHVAPLEALRNRQIVVDPGHGGGFAGAVSRYGLTEADVNMAVSSELARLLSEAGAHVTLTRTEDSPVPTGKDADLKKDLQRRVDLARSVNADLFVSVHHNADVSRESGRNDIEIYYKMGDAGPSLDVASYVQTHLSLVSIPGEAKAKRKSLKDKLRGQERKRGERRPRARKLLAGNYHVLRKSPMPAILTESSYMSDSANARRLSRERQVREEAYALFRGIAEYYSAGVPDVQGVDIGEAGSSVRWGHPGTVIVTENDRPVIRFIITCKEVDTSTVVLSVDGKSVDWQLDQDSTPGVARITHFPSQPLSSGKHNISLSLRNSAGNACTPASIDFTVALEPAIVLANVFPETVSADSRVRVVAEVLDKQHGPVADGLKIEFTANAGKLIENSGTTKSGKVGTWLDIPASARSENIEITARTPYGVTGRILVKVSDDALRQIAGIVSDGKTGNKLEGVLIRLLSGKDKDVASFDRTDQFGRYVVTIPREKTSPRAILSAYRRGYEQLSQPASISETANRVENIVLSPVLDGIFHGKKIAIDPACGGPDSGSTGPTGFRAADANLRMAEILRGMLVAAGAQVKLTREGDVVVSPQARTAISNNFGADYFVSISHGLKDERTQKNLDNDDRIVKRSLDGITYASHYPSSKTGKVLAGALSKSVAEVTGMPLETFPSSAYVLTNTACPAVLVRPITPNTLEREEKLRSADFLRAEAKKILEGLAAAIKK